MTLTLPEAVAHLTTFTVILSGILVIALGEWREMALKYACVAFSTLSGAFLLFSALTLNSSQFCGTNEVLCVSSGAHYVAMNLVLTGFHVAVGRDAIRVRHSNRRHANRGHEIWKRP